MFDYLYTEAKFTFNESGQTGEKTIFGGIISIFTIIVSLGCIGYFTYRLFNKDDSSIILSSEIDPYVNITYSHRIPFLVRFSDSYSIPYENQSSRLYNVYLRFWYGGTNNSSIDDIYQSFDTIKISKCNINEHFGEYKEYFNDVPDLESYFCPDLRKYNQTIYGIYGGTKPFSYLQFYFTSCLNETMNNTCFSKDYINKILSDVYLDLLSIDFKMDSLKKTVSKIEMKSERFSISNSVYKRIWMYLRKINYITDDGILFTRKNEENFHLYENVRTEVDIRDIKIGSVPGSFLTLTVLNNGEISIYHRKYQKLQDYIATIGGIIKAITIFGSLINYYNGRNSYYFHIIKNFFITNQIESSFIKYSGIKNNLNSSTHQNNNNNNYKSGSSFLQGVNSYSPFSKRKGKNNNVNENNNNSKTHNFQRKKIKKKKDFNNELILYNKFSSSFFPLIFFGKSEKERFKNNWYFANINKRLNIINVLNLLKKIEDLNLINKSYSQKVGVSKFFTLLNKNTIHKKYLEKEQYDNSEI